MASPVPAAWRLAVASCVWVTEQDDALLRSGQADVRGIVLDRLRDLCCSTGCWLSSAEYSAVVAGHTDNARRLSQPKTYEPGGAIDHLLRRRRQQLAQLEADGTSVDAAGESRLQPDKEVHPVDPSTKAEVLAKELRQSIQELEVLLRHRDFNIQKHARQLSHLPSLPTYAEFEAHAQQDFDAVRWVVEAAVQAQDLIDKMGLVDVAGRDDIHERALQDIMSVLNGGRPLPKHAEGDPSCTQGASHVRTALAIKSQYAQGLQCVLEQVAPCAHLEGPDDCGLAWLYLPQLPLTASVLSSSAEATQGPTPADTTTVDHSRGAAGAAAPKPPAPGGRGAHHGPPPLTLTGADEAPPDAAHASRRNVLRAGGLDKGPVGPPPSKALPGPLPIGPAALRLESGPGTKGVTLGGPGPRGGGGPMRAAGAPAPAPVPVSAVLASRAPAASSAEPGRAGPRPQELPLLGAAGGLAPAPALGPATTPTTTTERGPSPAVPQPAPPAPSGRPASPTCTPAPSTPRLRAPPTVRALSPIGFLYSPTDLTTPIKGPLIVPVVHSASPSPGPPWRGASPPRTAAATAGPHPLQAPAVLSPGAPPAADRRGSPCLIAGIYSPADAEGAEVGTQAAPVGFALSPCDDSGAEEGLCAAAGVPGNVLPEAPLRPDGRESCPVVAGPAGKGAMCGAPTGPGDLCAAGVPGPAGAVPALSGVGVDPATEGVPVPLFQTGNARPISVSAAAWKAGAAILGLSDADVAPMCVAPPSTSEPARNGGRDTRQGDESHGRRGAAAASGGERCGASVSGRVGGAGSGGVGSVADMQKLSSGVDGPMVGAGAPEVRPEALEGSVKMGTEDRELFEAAALASQALGMPRSGDAGVRNEEPAARDGAAWGPGPVGQHGDTVALEGFQTACGAQVRVSRSAHRRAQQMFGDMDISGSGAPDAGKGGAGGEAAAGTGPVLPSPAVRPGPEAVGASDGAQRPGSVRQGLGSGTPGCGNVGPGVASRVELAGFQTAAGAAISVSEESLRVGRALLEALGDGAVNVGGSRGGRDSDVGQGSGANRASGTGEMGKGRREGEAGTSHSARACGKGGACELARGSSAEAVAGTGPTDGAPEAALGFSTAGGRQISVSAESMAKARAMLGMDIAPDPAPASARGEGGDAEAGAPAAGGAGAGGGGGAFAFPTLDGARGSPAPPATPAPGCVDLPLFTMANGRSASVSATALAAARAMFADITPHATGPARVPGSDLTPGRPSAPEAGRSPAPGAATAGARADPQDSIPFLGLTPLRHDAPGTPAPATPTPFVTPFKAGAGPTPSEAPTVGRRPGTGRRVLRTPAAGKRNRFVSPLPRARPGTTDAPTPATAPFAAAPRTPPRPPVHDLYQSRPTARPTLGAFLQSCPAGPGTPPAPSWLPVSMPAAEAFRCGADAFGPREAHQALLSAGASSRLLELRWTAHHFAMVVWRMALRDLAGASWGNRPGRGVWLNRACILDRLLYRCERELARGHRPALRAVAQGDAAAVRPTVLQVTEVGVPTPGSLGVEVTDGWYRMRATGDGHLSRLAALGRLGPGSKILVCGAVLLCDRPGHPLDVFDSARLRIHGNGCRPAPPSATLGFVRGGPGVAPLHAVAADGGPVPALAAAVCAVGPLLYVEGGVARTARAEAAAAAAHQRAVETAAEHVSEMVRREEVERSRQLLRSLGRAPRPTDTAAVLHAAAVLGCEDGAGGASQSAEASRADVQAYAAERERALGEELQSRMRSALSAQGLRKERHPMPVVLVELGSLRHTPRACTATVAQDSSAPAPPTTPALDSASGAEPRALPDAEPGCGNGADAAASTHRDAGDADGGMDVDADAGPSCAPTAVKMGAPDAPAPTKRLHDSFSDGARAEGVGGAVGQPAISVAPAPKRRRGLSRPGEPPRAINVAAVAESIRRIMCEGGEDALDSGDVAVAGGAAAGLPSAGRVAGGSEVLGGTTASKLTPARSTAPTPLTHRMGAIASREPPAPAQRPPALGSAAPQGLSRQSTAAPAALNGGALGAGVRGTSNVPGRQRSGEEGTVAYLELECVDGTVPPTLTRGAVLLLSAVTPSPALPSLSGLAPVSRLGQGDARPVLLRAGRASRVQVLGGGVASLPKHLQATCPAVPLATVAELPRLPASARFDLVGLVVCVGPQFEVPARSRGRGGQAGMAQWVFLADGSRADGETRRGVQGACIDGEDEVRGHMAEDARGDAGAGQGPEGGPSELGSSQADEGSDAACTPPADLLLPSTEVVPDTPQPLAPCGAREGLETGGIAAADRAQGALATGQGGHGDASSPALAAGAGVGPGGGEVPGGEAVAATQVASQGLPGAGERGASDRGASDSGGACGLDSSSSPKAGGVPGVDRPPGGFTALMIVGPPEAAPFVDASAVQNVLHVTDVVRGQEDAEHGVWRCSATALTTVAVVRPSLAGTAARGQLARNGGRQPPARAGREGLVADRAARVGEWARSEEGARELQGMCLKIKSMLGL